MKTCTKCAVEKPVEGFGKRKRGSDRRNSVCLVCAKAHIDKWRKENPEKVKAQIIAWRAANLEKQRIADRQWRAKNNEKLKAKRAAYREANPEKVKARRLANLDKNRVHKQNRSHRERGGKLSPGLVAKLFKLQRGMCACCGRSLEKKYHLDHIMPLALGGAHEDSNMQLLRQECNLQKHAKHPIQFMQERGLLL